MRPLMRLENEQGGLARPGQTGEDHQPVRSRSTDILSRKHLLKDVFHAPAYPPPEAAGDPPGSKSSIKEIYMGHTYNNTITNSGGGDQNNAFGDGAIAKQVNITGTQAPAEDLLKLLAEIKARLPELPDKAQARLRNEVEGAELEAQEDKPDAAVIAAKLTAAQKVLAAIPGTVAAALPVGKLLGDALIWCGKMAGM